MMFILAFFICYLEGMRSAPARRMTLRLTPEERRQLGARCMGLDELPARPGTPPPPEFGLVGYHAVETLDPNRAEGGAEVLKRRSWGSATHGLRGLMLDP
jgi:hypothetical protein